MSEDLIEVELRCLVGPKRLFGKAITAVGRIVAVDNLMEFACSDCKRARRKAGLEVELVLHRFNLMGELVETVEVMKPAI